LLLDVTEHGAVRVDFFAVRKLLQWKMSEALRARKHFISKSIKDMGNYNYHDRENKKRNGRKWNGWGRNGCEREIYWSIKTFNVLREWR
jgi:hypothetical protein